MGNLAYFATFSPQSVVWRVVIFLHPFEVIQHLFGDNVARFSAGRETVGCIPVTHLKVPASFHVSGTSRGHRLPGRTSVRLIEAARREEGV